LSTPASHPQSHLSGHLASLSMLYDKADAAIAEFTKASGVSCPHACGTCCEGFVPDILPLEAAYIADWLSLNDPDRASMLAAGNLSPRTGDDGRQGCPLYADGTPYHCTVYEARPLICRMFGFAGTRDKLGETTFSVCKHGTSEKGPRKASGTALAAAFGMLPPVMADFGADLVSIDPDSAGRRAPLPEILPEAINRVLFLASMTKLQDQGQTPAEGRVRV